jgi:TatD DNase family protein
MIFFDTHTHFFLKEFDADRDQVVNKAIDSGVKYMLVPNVDSQTIEPLLSLCSKYPGNCFPAMGLHPTSVRENFQDELNAVERNLSIQSIKAIGEIGLDLYWDKSFFKQQITVLKYQFEWAIKLKFPVILHSRESLDELIQIVSGYKHTELRGVFHCFPGNYDQAKKVIDLGYKIGIGGVVTFKNSNLAEVVKKVSMDDMILETDSPYLAPVPYRGKRNESSHIILVAEKISEITSNTVEEIAMITTKNALNLFHMNKI